MLPILATAVEIFSSAVTLSGLTSMLATTFVSVLSRASTTNVSAAVYDVIFNSPPVTVLSLNTTLEIALTFTLASLKILFVITIEFTS